MIFLHLVNLVTRTHETDETQSISCAAALRAFLPVYERDGSSFCTYCNLSRGSEGPSGKTVWTRFNTHLTHFNTTHLPKEPVNFRAKGAFMIAVSYKIMLYLYPPTYSNFCLFRCIQKNTAQSGRRVWREAGAIRREHADRQEMPTSAQSFDYDLSISK